MSLLAMDPERKLLLAYFLLEEEEDDEILYLKKKRAKKHPMFHLKEKEGLFHKLISNHLRDDPVKFADYFRISVDQFDFLVASVKMDLTKNSYNRNLYPVTPEEKVAITLRFLATGESLHSLQFQFRLSVGAISQIIKNTLSALRIKLVPLFLPPPTPKILEEKAAEFGNKWNFPHCSGAIDGKHIRIVCPKNSGSLYHNYKGFFSIVLLAVVDANCKFIFVDVGSYGKEGDPGIFERSRLGKVFYEGALFPPPCKLPNTDVVLPFIFVGDDAFRLHPNLMKPYPREKAVVDKKKAIFNYRLSRARRTSENAFGLLSQVFRIFYTPINLLPETVDNVVIVGCCLHNMLREEYCRKNSSLTYEFNPTAEKPTTNLLNFGRTRGFANYQGFSVRDSFANYFNSDGRVSWQEQKA